MFDGVASVNLCHFQPNPINRLDVAFIKVTVVSLYQLDFHCHIAGQTDRRYAATEELFSK